MSFNQLAAIGYSTGVGQGCVMTTITIWQVRVTVVRDLKSQHQLMKSQSVNVSKVIATDAH